MAIISFTNYKRGQTTGCMGAVMRYTMQDKKTMWEGEPLVSGINCQPQSVYDDFLNTKLLYHKDSGVMFYHMVQSFPKGAAVDPRQAHEAARRLAEYFDGCEVLVCTHVDREHIHSHCVINSVNFETGKKLHMAKEQIQELMRRNDVICQEMGLPVFDAPTQQARGMGGAEYHTALKGQSWKLRLMNTIDECMKYAADKDAFVSLMESEGYAVCWESSRKYITYTTPDGMRCRDNKLHEEKYCKEAMEHEFRIRAEIVSARAQAAQLPAGSAAGADTTSGSTSHESGLGRSIRDCLSKKVMINNGERPKYYVENNHPAIIDSGTFGRVQEEMARRSGKRKVKQVGTKTEQGRYSSKYALTELLICGECGTPYRRCTWAANGKKKVVWRCINRLDYGKKYCHDSPSIEESVLQEAIMKAVMQTARQNAEVLKTLKLHIGMGLSAETTEDNSLDLQIRIAEIEAEFQKMLKAIAADNVEAFDEEKAKALMDEKAKLQIQLDRIADTKQKRKNAKSRLDEIFTIIEALANHPISYDDQIVRQILESVIVESKEKIKVVFVGGLEVTQTM